MVVAGAATSTLLLTAACGQGSDDAAPEGTSESPGAGDDAGAEAETGSYADGDYTASASYPNPSGTSSVTVDATLESGTVSAVTVTPEASGTSLQYQQQFAGGVADEVVGRPLDDLEVDKVAGSSLTSEGFNAAIEQIKTDASA